MTAPRFDWRAAVSNFTLAQGRALAAERGLDPFTFERLRERSLIGSVYVEKFKARCVAFPIHDIDGNVYRAHCRAPKGDNDGKSSWAYEPAHDPLGRPISALVIGNPATASRVFFFESQWDGIALIERLQLFAETDAGEVCVVATRGAQNAAKIKVTAWASGASLYTFPQNDPPGLKWLDDIIAILGGCYVIEIPSPYKDLGDWAKDPAFDITALEWAIDNAPLRQPARGAQQSQPGTTARVPRKLRGASIINFAEGKIDYSKNLLGNRWLSCSQGAFFVAPSGHGKSTWVIQAAACWSCGRAAFAIRPARPLRNLILQSEDDNNDVIEMSWLTDRLALTSAERDLVRKNTHVEWLNDVAGSEFFLVVDDFLTEFKPDVLIINPYTAYQGGDIRNDELNNQFLRVRLSGLLTKHSCGAIPVHHTPKTQFQKIEDFSWFDWMYSMAGGAALTNWARGVLIMVPTATPGTYKFIAAKRFEKIGWEDRECWFSHSLENGKFLWVPATEAQIAAAQVGRRQATPEAILGLIPVVDPILQEKLWVLAKGKLQVGEKTTRNLVKVLLHDGKIFEHSVPRQNASKFAKPAIGYSKTKPVSP
jgi:AAA domain